MSNPNREVRNFRPEIQALRTIAILSVLLFHFFPNRLPGGFIGVDVFFVISGFLITNHLIARFDKTKKLNLAEFWSARMRRILPASFLVTLATMALTFIAVPETYWVQWFGDASASALYFQNWHLAAVATDYLGAMENPSPYQHFWSLSVEEQFYLFWPLLLALALVFKVRQSARAKFIAIASVVIALSLAYSIWFTGASPAEAYFSTFTRAWQFAAGGLLGILTLRTKFAPKNAVAFRTAGLAMILASCFVITGETAYPGWAALLPTLGTLLVIFAAEKASKTDPVMWVFKNPIVQWIADHSYSIYLWHWPLLVIGPWLLQAKLTSLSKLLLIALAFALAFVSKRFVEDPFRFNQKIRNFKPSRIMIAMLAVTLTIGGGAWAIAHQVQRNINAELKSSSAATQIGKCTGAGAIVRAECDLYGTQKIHPSQASMKSDTAGVYRCYNQQPVAEPESCNLGIRTQAKFKVALTGDSHGAMLIPALKNFAQANNWKLVTFVGRGCVLGNVPPADGHCAEQLDYMKNQLIAEKFDAVIVTGRRLDGLDPETNLNTFTNLASVTQELKLAGVSVIVVEDNPMVPDEKIECALNQKDLATNRSKCDFTVGEYISKVDALSRAAKQVSDAYLIDTQSYYCRDQICPMVAGDTIVYRDRDHITASFARTLTQFIGPRIQNILEGK